MKLVLKMSVLLSTLIFFQSSYANDSDGIVVHIGECLQHEIAQGFKTGVHWYNGGHAGPELREVCLRPKTHRLGYVNTSNNSQFFIASGVASAAWPNAEKLAKEQMWKNAQKLCNPIKAFRVSNVYIFDVGTVFAARAYFQCTQN